MKKNNFSWGMKIVLFIFSFSILMFPISPSVSLDSEGKALNEIEAFDNIQMVFDMESELNADTISGIAAAASTTSAITAPIELY